LSDRKDIETLKLELVQQLVALNDASILSSTKRYLDLLLSRSASPKEDDDQALMAAAELFGRNAYGDDEPDISDLELKEPNPNYGDETR
jgi:hypothetical protein